MIIKIDDLKNLSQIILPAVETTDLSSLTDTLELYAHDGILQFFITNKEYFLDTRIKIDPDIEFKATINANLFLRLIAQTTTDTVELTLQDSYLILKGNGTYKLPLIFEDEKMFELPRIDISNVISSFDIDGNILHSILQFNTKQLSVGILSRPVQKLYYVDEKGCITFTSGACVNSFTLSSAVKLLLNQRLVKLFKLFKDRIVKFTYGKDSISEEISQTKVKFEVDDLVLTAILPGDDAMLKSVPVDAIRSRATNNYPHSVSIDKQTFIDSISRIKLFVASSRAVVPYAQFTFTGKDVIISDLSKDNKESVSYVKNIEDFGEDYSMYLDLNELNTVLDTCVESSVTLSFGDGQAVILKRGSVVNIIPEVSVD